MPSDYSNHDPPKGLLARDLIARDLILGDGAPDVQPAPPAQRRPRKARDAQKQAREARLLDVASHLFSVRGYHRTSIEDIAARAGLAVGTVYNYFGSKAELLKRIVLQGRPEALRRSGLILADPPADPEEAIARLLLAHLQGALRHDKRLWRVVHATGAAEPKMFGLEYRRTTVSELGAQVAQLLELLRDRGDIAPDVDIAEAAQLLKLVSSEIFRRFVADDAAPFEQMERELRPKVRIILRGLGPTRPSPA